MPIRQLIIFTIFLPTLLHGQTNYKYEYKIFLKDQLSSYSLQTDSTLQDKCIISFIVLDNKGDSLPFSNIKIKSSKIDTILRTDINGLSSSITLQADTFRISVLGMGHTALIIDKIFLKEKSKITFKASLGKLNSLYVGHIYSLRKLTKNEIEKIKDDLSKDNDDNELLKNKTCYVLFEI